MVVCKSLGEFDDLFVHFADVRNREGGRFRMQFYVETVTVLKIFIFLLD